MARFLALDGDSNLIQLLGANVKGETIRLERSLTWEEGNAVSAANAADVGGRLREQIKAAGIAPAPLLVCVGRDRVIVKEMKIPAVPDHEEPALVRFQALKEFTDGGQEVVLDYLPLGPSTPEGRRIQVMSVRKDLVSAYRKLAEAAGLKLAAITPRPFALMAGLIQAIAARQVPAPDPAGAPVGLLVRGNKWGEFIIVRNGALALQRSIAGPALTSDTALLGEIRRNLALHANQNVENPVRVLYLAEADTPGGLRDRLQESLAIPVYAYEPVVGIPVPDGPVGGLAGLAGLLALQATRDPGINFVKPREPKPPVDPNRHVLLWGSLVAAALLALFAIFSYFRIAAKSNTVALLERNRDQTADLLKDVDPDAKRIKALDEWSAANVNKLDELYDLTDRMRDTNNVRLLTITSTPMEERNAKPSAKAAKGPKFVSQMTLRGLSKADTPLNEFYSELVQESAYEVSPKQVKRNVTVDNRIFGQDFTIKVELQKRTPDQYRRVLNVEAPPRRRAADDAGAERDGGDQ